MTYSTSELARLSGVSPRTLRYYDQISLLTPPLAVNGYRQYGPTEVDRLQLILAYRALDFSLTEIAGLLALPAAARTARLMDQQAKLAAQIERLQRIRDQITATLTNQKGDQKMTDDQKFMAFKQDQLRQNDEAYGAEVVARYGQAAKTAADQRYAGLTQAQFDAMAAAQETLAAALRAYLEAPALPSPAAERAYRAHREWLLVTTPQLTAAMHRGFGEMYEADPRFAAYYTNLVGDPGAAAAMNAIIAHYATD
ncbi:MerR family transcriptional regulator [Lacticaseibacillus absianus]|uniref:MerR family transcriptional regulator n=1 Tax=Lacticaseibacillus absianus TaxID=2729623 RepID=UPI0015C77B85|nr:MerR family transcriptional regulator [Lacticaseibacillus absianus]